MSASIEKCRSESYLVASPRRSSPLANVNGHKESSSSLSSELSTASAEESDHFPLLPPTWPSNFVNQSQGQGLTVSEGCLRSEAYSDWSDASNITPRSEDPGPLVMYSPRSARRPRCYSLDLSKIPRPYPEALRHSDGPANTTVSQNSNNGVGNGNFNISPHCASPHCASPRTSSPLSSGRKTSQQASPHLLYSASIGSVSRAAAAIVAGKGMRRRSFHGEAGGDSPCSSASPSPRLLPTSTMAVGTASPPSTPSSHSNPLSLEACSLTWHEVLGRGATATIYRATAALPLSIPTVLPLATHAAVIGLALAVKVIGTETYSREERQALNSEIELWRCLQHPNLLPLLGVRRSDFQIQLLMPLCSYSLRTYLQTQQTAHNQLAPATLMTLGRGIAAALAYLHGRPTPIIHRDLKPENIMLLIMQSPGGSHPGTGPAIGSTPPLTPLLADFSEAFSLEGPERICHQANRGTLLYRAPEMCHASFEGQVSYNEKVDIWAFGILLTELLTLRMPYSGESRDDLVLALVSKGQRPSELLLLRDEHPPADSPQHIALQLAFKCTERKAYWRPTALRCQLELRDGGT